MTTCDKCGGGAKGYLCAQCRAVSAPIEGPRVLSTLEEDRDQEIWERAFFAALTGCSMVNTDADKDVAYAARVADFALCKWQDRWMKP